ncbi:MAG: DUF433 domain-containing protein [bacterium]
MKDWKSHIEANPAILYGKPVIKGTRISVDLILEKMSCGQNFQDIIQSYPDLKEEDLYACLAYASSLIRNEVTKPLAS